MLRSTLLFSFVVFATSTVGFAQDLHSVAGLNVTPLHFADSQTNWASLDDFQQIDFSSHRGWDAADSGNKIDFHQVYRGQSPSGGGDSGGAGASAATDPSAILTQLQLQNVFTPESYNASGYQNTFIVQPVLPFPVAMPGLKKIFPAHIMRPTLPIIAPSANPDGPRGSESGLGDLTLLDAYVHNVEGFGTILAGYTAILPTATNSQLGQREWQLGPSFAVLYKEIPKWLIGVVYQQPFSFQSNAQQVLIQPVIVRHLADEWYVRWGDLNWVFNTETGDYSVPLNLAVGKVAKFGNQPVNLFVEPFYTPSGLHSGPGGDKWGIKLNVTFLFPDKKLPPLCGCVWDKKKVNCDSCY